MERRVARSGRRYAGGIVSLAEFCQEHHKALEYDLMRCGYTMKDIGRSLPWGALRSFIENIGAESATARSIDPEVYEWTTRTKTNMILADIYDMLALINANLVASASKKHTKKPKFYPRPKNKDDAQHFGADPIPVEEMRKRFAENRKRRKHG